MKTIAISIDVPILQAVERIARQRAEGHGVARRRKPNRSEVIRSALLDFVLRCEKEERESRDRLVFAAHRSRLARQARALVAEQAEP